MLDLHLSKVVHVPFSMWARRHGDDHHSTVGLALQTDGNGYSRSQLAVKCRGTDGEIETNICLAGGHSGDARRLRRDGPNGHPAR